MGTIQDDSSSPVLYQALRAPVTAITEILLAGVSTILLLLLVIVVAVLVVGGGGGGGGRRRNSSSTNSSTSTSSTRFCYRMTRGSGDSLPVREFDEICSTAHTPTTFDRTTNPSSVALTCFPPLPPP